MEEELTEKKKKKLGKQINIMKKLYNKDKLGRERAEEKISKLKKKVKDTKEERKKKKLVKELNDSITAFQWLKYRLALSIQEAGKMYELEDDGRKLNLNTEELMKLEVEKLEEIMELVIKEMDIIILGEKDEDIN